MQDRWKGGTPLQRRHAEKIEEETLGSKNGLSLKAELEGKSRKTKGSSRGERKSLSACTTEERIRRIIEQNNLFQQRDRTKPGLSRDGTLRRKLFLPNLQARGEGRTEGNRPRHRVTNREQSKKNI